MEALKPTAAGSSRASHPGRLDLRHALREALVWTDATLAEMGLAHRAGLALVA